MRKPSIRWAVCGVVLLATAAVAGAAPADHTVTVTGTIARIQASERALTVTLADGSDIRFVWNPDTKISGVLAPGARVTVRYEKGTDGRNLAQQISVTRS
jgi:uncharacterized protein YabE (DUF348 family)